MVCWLFVGSASFASVFAYFVPRMDLAGVFLIGLALSPTTSGRSSDRAGEEYEISMAPALGLSAPLFLI